MTLEFAVIILQNKQDGTANISRTPYATETEAWKAFYRSCGNAVDSENLTDAVIIMNKEGFTLDYKYFEHPAKSPAPENSGE